MIVKFPTSIYGMHRLSDDAVLQLLHDFRWPNGTMCPHCDGEHCHRPASAEERVNNPRVFTRVRGRPAWRCARCKRQIRVFANTGLHGTKVPMRKWLHCIWLVGKKSSISGLQLSKEIDVTRTTADFMLKRVRELLADHHAPQAPARLHRGTVVTDRRTMDDDDVTARPPSALAQHAYPQEVLLAVEKVKYTRNGKPDVYRCARLALAAAPLGVDFALFAARVIAPGARCARTGAATWPLRNFEAMLRGAFHGVSRKFLAAYAREFMFRFRYRRHERHIPGLIARRLLQSRRLPRSALRVTRPSLDLTPEQLPPPPSVGEPPTSQPPQPSEPVSSEELLLELLAEGRHAEAAALLSRLRAQGTEAAPG